MEKFVVENILRKILDKYPEKAPICEICNGKHFTNNHSKFSNTTASHYSVCFPLSKNRFSENTINSWIFDSGASDHFCNDISLMKNLEPASAWVNTANGDMKVSKIGSVKLPGNSFVSFGKYPVLRRFKTKFNIDFKTD